MNISLTKFSIIRNVKDVFVIANYTILVVANNNIIIIIIIS